MRHHLGAGVRDDIPLLAQKPRPQTDEPCHVGSGRALRAVGACRNRATGRGVRGRVRYRSYATGISMPILSRAWFRSPMAATPMPAQR